MRDPVGIRQEPRIGGELSDTQRLAEPWPLPLAADRHGKLAIGGRERLVRDDVRMAVAAAARRPAGHERVLRLVHQDGEGRFEQRDVDPLARARGPFALAREQTRRGSRPSPNSPVTTSLIATPTFTA